MATTTTDHDAYIRAVAHAIPYTEEEWAWDHTHNIDEDALEVHDACVAVGRYIGATGPGRAGVIALPGGHAVGWHERDGWELADRHGDRVIPLGVAIDADPAAVARAVAKI